MDSYLGWKIDFLNPAGEVAYSGPESVGWQIMKNPVSRAIGGVCAVLLEFADPRIRSGVWDHSVFKTDPIGRAARTGVASMVGTYGPQKGARRIIQGVTNMHSKVKGTTPDGVAYTALDVELLDWVYATAGYGFLMAYDRFARPVSDADKNRFFEEGTAVSALYGVKEKIQSLEHFDKMLAAISPGFEPHPINTEFLKIVETYRGTPALPQIIQKQLVRAAVDILPQEVRKKLELGSEYDLSWAGRQTVKAMARLADQIPDKSSPAALSCERLGLPRNFLWKKPGTRARLLEELQAAG